MPLGTPGVAIFSAIQLSIKLSTLVSRAVISAMSSSARWAGVNCLVIFFFAIMLPPGATGFPLETGTPLWVLIVSLSDAAGQGSVAAVIAGAVKLALIQLPHV